VLAQTRAPAAGAFEPEYEPARRNEVLSPVLKLGIASRGRGDRQLCEQLPDLVERDRVAALLVVSTPTAIIVFSSSLVMWRPSDRAVLSDVQASMKSRRHPWTTAGDRSLRGH